MRSCLPSRMGTQLRKCIYHRPCHNPFKLSQSAPGASHYISYRHIFTPGSAMVTQYQYNSEYYTPYVVHHTHITPHPYYTLHHVPLILHSSHKTPHTYYTTLVSHPTHITPHLIKCNGISRLNRP